MNRKEDLLKPSPPPDPDDLPAANPVFPPSTNEAILRSEVEGGADLAKLQVGRKLSVRTEGSLYTIERRNNGLYIKGNAEFCPDFVKVASIGSNFGTNIFRPNFIGRKMYLVARQCHCLLRGAATTTRRRLA